MFFETSLFISYNLLINLPNLTFKKYKYAHYILYNMSYDHKYTIKYIRQNNAKLKIND